MGASFNAISYQGTRDQVLKKWNSDVEDTQYECGHGGNYTGSISELGKGFNDTGKTFKSREEAEEYIEEHHQKWDGAMAVRYLKKGGLAKSSASKQARLQSSLDKAIGYRESLQRKVVSDLRNAKSKLIGCRNSGCQSKINRNFITVDGKCPLCHQSLLSPTAQNRLAVADNKVVKAQRDLRNYKPTESKSAKTTMWLIGGWCSE